MLSGDCDAGTLRDATESRRGTDGGPLVASDSQVGGGAAEGTHKWVIAPGCCRLLEIALALAYNAVVAAEAGGQADAEGAEHDAEQEAEHWRGEDSADER